MAISTDYQRFFKAHDLADFAQEFLRRSPAYRQEYAALAARRRTPMRDTAMGTMARKWGLEFRNISDRRCTFASCLLVSGSGGVRHCRRR